MPNALRIQRLTTGDFIAPYRHNTNINHLRQQTKIQRAIIYVGIAI